MRDPSPRSPGGPPSPAGPATSASGQFSPAPLRAMDKPVGALNIYSRRPDVFAEWDEEMASVFAAETSAILSGAMFNVAGQTH